MSEITQKSELLAERLSANASQIPNVGELVRKLKSERKAGHVIHAFMVKRLIEDGTFKVTHVEKNTGGHDIEIELNGLINCRSGTAPAPRPTTCQGKKKCLHWVE